MRSKAPVYRPSAAPPPQPVGRVLGQLKGCCWHTYIEATTGHVNCVEAEYVSDETGWNLPVVKTYMDCS